MAARHRSRGFGRWYARLAHSALSHPARATLQAHSSHVRHRPVCSTSFGRPSTMVSSPASHLPARRPLSRLWWWLAPVQLAAEASQIARRTVERPRADRLLSGPKPPSHRPPVGRRVATEAAAKPARGSGGTLRPWSEAARTMAGRGGGVWRLAARSRVAPCSPPRRPPSWPRAQQVAGGRGGRESGRRGGESALGTLSGDGNPGGHMREVWGGVGRVGGAVYLGPKRGVYSVHSACIQRCEPLRILGLLVS